MNSAAHKATKIEGTHDYRYRGVRVRCSVTSGGKGYYFVADFVMRNQFGALNPRRMFSSLANAKCYIDLNLDKAE